VRLKYFIFLTCSSASLIFDAYMTEHGCFVSCEKTVSLIPDLHDKALTHTCELLFKCCL
jgi:hypothetical protein